MKRTYVGEMELALQKANSAKGDRNENRAAELEGWLRYGMDVAVARRSKSPIPPRPSGRFI